MPLPDYTASVLNVVASVADAFGVEPTVAPLADLPAERLRGRPVVMLLVDGLGHEFLSRHPDSFLARHLSSRLTSVFPSTTATVITSLSTGVPPRRHAITGWFTWLRELGSVAAVLPFRSRHGGSAPFSAGGISPRDIVGAPPLTERLAVESHVISPNEIIDSDYSRAMTPACTRHGHRGLADLFGRLHELVAEGEERYIFAYWTEIDSLAHHEGANSVQAVERFRAFDAALAEFASAARGSGALLMVTADHGLIDTTPDRILRIEEHPPLADALALPLCGEPRAAFCYLRPGRRAEFETYAVNELGHACELRHSQELVEEGWFGPGPTDPRLFDRIGDVALIMKENWVIRDRLLGEKPFSQVGVHGGLDAAEMYVPLAILEL